MKETVLQSEIILQSVRRTCQFTVKVDRIYGMHVEAYLTPNEVKYLFR